MIGVPCPFTLKVVCMTTNALPSWTSKHMPGCDVPVWRHFDLNEVQ